MKKKYKLLQKVTVIVETPHVIVMPVTVAITALVKDVPVVVLAANKY